MVEHALPGSTHMGLLANNIKWMGGFPPYPPKIEKNWKLESHAEEAHCSVHVILFTALSATPSTFNSLSNILFISPLSPGRASTKSSLSTMLVFMVTLGMVLIPNGWSSPVSKNQLADGWLTWSQDIPKMEGEQLQGFFGGFMLSVWNAYLINRDDQRNPRVSLEGSKNYVM